MPNLECSVMNSDLKKVVDSVLSSTNSQDHSHAPVSERMCVPMVETSGSITEEPELMAAPSLLMVDDDRELCQMVARYLRGDGFSVETVHDGDDGLSAVASGRFDLMILDVMMPDMSGQEVLHRLRSEPIPGGTLPVLMLTARGDEVDRVIGLETGADDYLAKPCSLRELAARARAILRRAASTQSRQGRHSENLTIGDIDLDTRQRSVSCRGRRLVLTDAEYNILLCLANSLGTVVSKQFLSKRTLGRDFLPTDRSVDVHIANLRKKFAKAQVERVLIKTARGAGYWLIDQPD